MADELKRILYTTNNQKILYFLMEHISEEFYDRQISKLTGVSRAGTNFALRELVKGGLIKRENRGRMSFYRLEHQNILIKHLKLVQNIVILKPLIDELISSSLQIILYGSASISENTAQSDFDIFILTREPKEIQKIISKIKLKEGIQYIIKTPNELAKLQKSNEVFYKEILSGIVLWEEKKT